MSAARASPVGPDTGRVSLLGAPSTASCSAPPLPNGPCPVCPRLAIQFEPWRQAGYWKAQHQRALAREALLRQENTTPPPPTAPARTTTPRPQDRAHRRYHPARAGALRRPTPPVTRPSTWPQG